MDGIVAALQVVITWSSAIGIGLFPIALGCLAVAAWSAHAGRRLQAALWAVRLVVWPWRLYLWAIGLGVVLAVAGRLGWLALLVLPLLFVVFGARVTWFGILAIAVNGQWLLAALLAAIAVAVWGWALLAVWVVNRRELAIEAYLR